MMRLSEAARALDAGFSGPDAVFTQVGTDTRALMPGSLFVALKGERFDGHDYVAQALEAGAVGALVTREFAARAELPGHAALVQVDDTRRALGALAAHWRRTFSLPLIAVTGSNGKTTVKEMTAAILRAQAGNAAAVLATEGNLNNDIGVPLTLLRLREPHRYAVIEMGMNHPGEIGYLTRLAAPTVALVNNAQAAHLEGLGNIDAIAREKGSIYEGLGTDGIAIINADDAHAPLWRAMNEGRRTLEFGLDAGAPVGGRYELRADGTALALRLPDAELAVRLRVGGVHNVRNALAAAAAAHAAGASPDAIKAGLESFGGVPGRQQRRTVLHGATLIDDTYNANPDSMRAAIDVLAAQPGRRVLVLGDMGELGADSARLHAGVGAYARAKGIERLLCLGDMMRHAADAFGTGAQHYERIQELLADLENLLAPDVTVLVKGSRFMEMERVVKSFTV